MKPISQNYLDLCEQHRQNYLREYGVQLKQKNAKSQSVSHNSLQQRGLAQEGHKLTLMEVGNLWTAC